VKFKDEIEETFQEVNDDENESQKVKKVKVKE